MKVIHCLIVFSMLLSKPSQNQELFYMKGNDMYINIEHNTYYQVIELYHKYGYSANSYCWESFITLLLKSEYDIGLEYVDFNSEADMFTAQINDENQKKHILLILNEKFSNIEFIENVIKNADRGEIDD